MEKGLFMDDNHDDFPIKHIYLKNGDHPSMIIHYPVVRRERAKERLAYPYSLYIPYCKRKPFEATNWVSQPSKSFAHVKWLNARKTACHGVLILLLAGTCWDFFWLGPIPVSCDVIYPLEHTKSYWNILKMARTTSDFTHPKMVMFQFVL